MREEFKRLKRWVEECPVEAAIRIEELELKHEKFVNESYETVKKLEREVRMYRETALERQARVGEYLVQNEQKQQEIERLKNNLSFLCPVADMPVIESLKLEKLHMMEQMSEQKQEIERYKTALEEITRQYDYTSVNRAKEIAKNALK